MNHKCPFLFQWKFCTHKEKSEKTSRKIKCIHKNALDCVYLNEYLSKLEKDHRKALISHLKQTTGELK